MVFFFIVIIFFLIYSFSLDARQQKLPTSLPTNKPSTDPTKPILKTGVSWAGFSPDSLLIACKNGECIYICVNEYIKKS